MIRAALTCVLFVASVLVLVVLQPRDERPPQPAVSPGPPESAPLAPGIHAGTAQDLEQLIFTALTQGQSEACIDALVKQAAQRGGVAIPDTIGSQRSDRGAPLLR